MDVGGIFRNLFRLPPRNDEKCPAQSTVVPDSHPDVYDDTDLAHLSKGQAGSGSNWQDQGRSQPRKDKIVGRLPTFRDIEDESGCDENTRITPKSREIFGPNFVFGEMFSAVREMFGEMERSMNEMDEFFNNDNFSNFGFGFNTPGIPGQGSGPFVTEPDDDDDGNIRDRVLKRDDVPRPPLDQRVDQNLDDLYKDTNKKLDLSVIPRMPKGTLEEAWKSKDGSAVDPTQPKGQFQFSRIIRQYKSSPDGSVEQKTIRETNEGREITTYRKNDKGEVEENQEFVPRNEISEESNQTINTRLPTFSRTPFHDFFFPRPRM